MIVVVSTCDNASMTNALENAGPSAIADAEQLANLRTNSLKNTNTNCNSGTNGKSHSSSVFFNKKKNLYFFLFLDENICCGYSLEAPPRGASNEYPQHIFSSRNKITIYHIWRSSLIRVYTVCHSTKYLKKLLHKKQNLSQKSTE